jgi:hypothetical protein
MLYLELLPDEVYQLVYKNIYDGVVLELNDLIKRNSYMTGDYEHYYSYYYFIWRLTKEKFFKCKIYREPKKNLMFSLDWYRSLYPLRLVYTGCPYGWEMDTHFSRLHHFTISIILSKY